MRTFASAVLVLVFVMVAAPGVMAQVPYWMDPDPLPQRMTAEEELRSHEIGMFFQPTPPPTGTIRNIAEFERNEAALIRYPLAIPMELVALMSEHVRVITIVSGNFQQTQATTAFNSNGVNMDNVDFLHAPSNSVWTRDYGPFYIADENHQVSIVDFVYNRPRPADDAIPSALASFLDVPAYGMNLVHTGGNYMTDGWGISASTDLILEENNFNEALVLQRMDEYLAISNYHVTIDPQNTYLKHIDTWAKFLDVDKILIARVPINHPNYDDHEMVAEYFAAELSAYGTPYQVFRVDTPNGQPYTNSLILNERVYVPTVNSTWDAAALAAYEAAMPGYEVIGIYFNGWLSTDALHCRVKEVADREMLHIAHVPLSGELPAQPEFDLEVDIIPYSGADLINEELYLIHRSGTAAFDTTALTHIGGHTFAASIPVTQNDTEIAYYFSAADASGRTETWPLIGPEGARSFTVDHGAVSTDPDAASTGIALEAAYPNPVADVVTISYQLDAPLHVRLEIFNLMGQRVATIVDETQSAGQADVTFDTAGLASGTYLYRLVAGDVVQTRQFVVLR